MAERRLTVVSDRPVPADQLLKQATKAARASTVLQRIETLFPRIKSPLEGVADALLSEMAVDEARDVLIRALGELNQSWEQDVEDWRQDTIDVMGLLRRTLTAAYRPAIEALGERAPASLTFHASPSGERLEGTRVWQSLRTEYQDGGEAGDGADPSGTEPVP